MSTIPIPIMRIQYEKAAEKYLYSLPLEHFMEATPQATQREITLESLALVKAQLDDLHVFNELLVQYPLKGTRIGQIVPDNMVVIFKGPIDALGSYDIPLQPARPFWVMEYVSKINKRKDYENSLEKYERELKVPYYLVFYPDNQEMTLFKLRGKKYVSVKPNKQGRCPIRELDMEVALLDGWVRYWFRGELLPLPAELLLELQNTQKELARQKRIADDNAKRADDNAKRADDNAKQLKMEQEARLAVERELKQLRKELNRSQGP